MRYVDAGNRARRNRPGGRSRPVSTIDQSRPGGTRKARRLRLRKCCRRRDVRRDLTSTVALVIAEAKNVEVVRRRWRLDLEDDGLALVDAHRRGEAHNGRVPVAGN